MKEDYEKSKVDLQKGLDGIQAALEKLQTYYGLSPRPWPACEQMPIRRHHLKNAEQVGSRH